MKTRNNERRASRGLPGCRERKVKKIVRKSVLSVLFPKGLNTSDEHEWFHFQGNSLPSLDAFIKGKAYSAENDRPSLTPSPMLPSSPD
jgi:hypothetical protein